MRPKRLRSQNRQAGRKQCARLSLLDRMSSPRNTTREGEIVLHLDSVDQLVEPSANSPFLKRRLREDAEEFIVESATALPRKAAAKLVVLLPEDEGVEVATVADAVHQHFTCRRVEAEKELSRTIGWGWRSLLIGLVFLSLVIALAEVIRRFLPPGNFSSVIQIGLSILAWVALWRPGELLLYEWYPFRRDARIFRKLEQAEIQLGIRAKDVN